MSRESDDNLSSINSAYTGNYTFMFHLYLIDCIFLFILIGFCVTFNLFPRHY